MDKNQLIEFEKEIGALYSDGKIKAPIHLSGGNEQQLIEIFQNIHQQDWIFSTYRNHYHALLKGMPPQQLRDDIIDGRSMHIMNKAHKIFTTSIVGGHLSIALGTALALKRKQSHDKVFVFCGDMCSETGVFHECAKYAYGHNLPIEFIIEDNEVGVYTNTKSAWGMRTNNYYDATSNHDKVYAYQYRTTYPHHGAGLWVSFPDHERIDINYKSEVINAMSRLGQDPRTIFLGQTVGVKGSPVFESLSGVPLEKRIELPIMEEVQAGMSIGLALEGFIPISIFPRFDFMTLATNQLVNHLDKVKTLSHSEFNPIVITRTIVGAKVPLDPGVQHSQNHTNAYRLMLPNTNVVELTSSADIMASYMNALQLDRPSLFVEHARLY
jgi:pyruvate dehydrogenase E1 component alpha subunit